MKLKLILPSLVVFGAVLSIWSCHRPTSGETSKVTLQLPGGQALANCTRCLKVVVVNVDGSGITKTIVLLNKTEKIQSAGTEISGSVEIEVPVGSQRKFQVIAMYLESDKTLSVHYASVTQDVSIGGPAVNMTLESQGTFKQGHIVGRFLTGPNAGPTGKVSTSFTLPNKPDVKVLFGTSDILNGWFNFFASENFPMTYELQDGTVIFQRVTVESLVPLAGSALLPNRARIHYPASYFKDPGSGPYQEETDTSDFIYGFFGDSTSIANKRVCLQYTSTPAVLNRLSTNSGGSPKLYYGHNLAVGGSVYGVSGLADNGGGCVSATSNNTALFTEDQISVTVNQLDGQGNDSASAMAGAFSYVYSSGFAAKYRYASSLYEIRVLPGLFSADRFGSVKLFKKSGAVNGGADEMQCTQKWMDENGFSPAVLPAPATFNSELVSFSLPASEPVTNGFVVCPTKAGEMQDVGGFYLGGVLTASLSISGSAGFTNGGFNEYELQNNGTGALTLNPVLLSGQGGGGILGGEYQYSSGGFPGIPSSNPCSLTLAAGATCRVKIIHVLNTGSGTGGSFKVYFTDSHGVAQFQPVNFSASP